jgi:hypothetical protein
MVFVNQRKLSPFYICWTEQVWGFLSALYLYYFRRATGQEIWIAKPSVLGGSDQVARKY